jgi:hypothetical protein
MLAGIQSLHTASDIIKKYETGELSLDEQEKSTVLLNSLQNIVSQSGAISRYFWPSRDTPQKATDTQKNYIKTEENI